MRSRSKSLQIWLIATIVLAVVLGSCKSAPAPTATAEPQVQGFNWRKYAGTELYLFLNKHPYAEALLGQIGKFEEKTGIKVRYDMLSEGEFMEKLRIELAAGTGLYDAFMTGPYTEWEYAPAGWLEPLELFVNDPAKTDQAYYKFEDFYPNTLAANMWDLNVGSGVGQGHLWAVPTMVETYIIAYRADLFAKYNLKAPTTLQEMYDAASVLTKGEGGDFRGWLGAGDKGGNAVWTGFPSTLMSHAATKLPDFDIVDGKLKCVINQPALVPVTDLWIKNVRDNGPLGWTAITWYDAMELFSTGRYGMIYDCDFFASNFEDPVKSQVAGKVKYASPVAPVGGTPASSMWTWGLSMNSKSKNKDAAWLLMQWATGPDTLLAATRDFRNYNPTRKSVWDDPTVSATLGKWGEGTYMTAVRANLEKYARIGWTPEPQIWTLADYWSVALQEIWSGAKTTQQALDDAAKQMDATIAQVGIKPGPIGK
ncbi:MAG: putative ABC transporter-binding protein precursor [Chloroflexi bacterium ADurb.Bin180]|nr:MAG: putative ABC transporter-binding protein precursor [Chloroflexi bacterium ADurb.Bin180]